MTRILVAGDAMIDRYLFGEVLRLSPEGKVPVLSDIHQEERQGGAANVAATIRALGCPDTKVVYGAGPPIIKTRIVALRWGKPAHIVRLDEDHQQYPVNLTLFKEALRVCQIVVLVDYAKGALSKVEGLMEAAREAGAMVLVDPKGHQWERYRGAALIKPNKDEMADLVGKWSSEEELNGKAKKLLVDSDIGAIMLTRAERGMSLYTKEGNLHVPAERVNVECVSGAGEAALSAMAVSLAKGMGFSEGLRYAVKAASVAISRFGTTIVREHEVFDRGTDLKAV